MRRGLAWFVAAIAVTTLAAQEGKAPTGYDGLLDNYVRDGLVYYRALKSDRAKLDRYVNELGAAAPARMTRSDQVAFWLNAYNAIVLQTVVNHYPVQGAASQYPKNSIRQIPGAFDRTMHRVGGRTVTLDQIEQSILAEFHDPRLFLALGRGALGSGRLKSEAYTGANLEAQLTETAGECVGRQTCFQLDRVDGKMHVTAVFSWREKDFAAAYAGSAPSVFASRSPVERAVIAFVEPKLLSIEKEYLARNTFSVAFTPFDWRLNDLTGRGGR
jgi:hypothetical protein